MEQNECWITSKEACESLSVSHQTLMLWIESKHFTAIKVGKFWRYKQDEIDRWMLEGNENPSNKAG